MELESRKELDNLVERFDMDRCICPGASRFCGNNNPSDAMMDSWASFFIKGVARKKFGTKYDTMRMWGPTELLALYHSKILGQDGKVIEAYELDLSHPTSEKHLLGATREAKESLIYRWNSGMLFTTYSERVQMELERLAVEKADKALEAAKIIDEILSLKRGLEGKVDQVCTDPRIVKRFKAMIANLTVMDIIRDEDE
jgi:hypothetical protein